MEKKPKILLIGASGKLGSCVLQELLKNEWKYEIGVLVRKSATVNLNLNYQIFIGDILMDNLIPAFEWADLVVNCSGIVSYARKDKKLLYKTNIEGVKNILQACLRLNKPLIHTSSAIVYGSSACPIIFSEEDAVKQVYRGEYAQSKLKADQFIQASDIPYIIFRPGTLISTLTKLHAFYQKGFVAELRGGASFALREEVAKAYISGIDYLLNSNIQAVFNLGGNNKRFLEVFDCFKELDYKNTKFVKYTLLHLLSIVNDYLLNPIFKKNILTQDNFITGNHFTFINSTKAQRELNYKIPSFNMSLKEVIIKSDKLKLKSQN